MVCGFPRSGDWSGWTDLPTRIENRRDIHLIHLRLVPEPMAATGSDPEEHPSRNGHRDFIFTGNADSSGFRIDGATRGSARRVPMKFILSNVERAQTIARHARELVLPGGPPGILVSHHKCASVWTWESEMWSSATV